MKIGYFYWGFLGDKKYNSSGDEVSTPDGNAFYSWSIIKGFQDKGHDVILISDRDTTGYNKLGMDLFSSFAKNARHKAYINSKAYNADIDLDMLLLEWRWNIPGRNDEATKINNPTGYQPDREIMEDLLNAYNALNVPIVVFDLDYKLTEEEVDKFGIKYVIELGNKWANNPKVKSMKVQIPFDFTYIDEFAIKMNNYTSDVIYIGNRYERDWCIDKYLPEGTVVHGNWLEPGHGDPVNEWPHLEFRKRLTASEIQKPYNNAVSTVLLAKKEYCDMGFMTARIQEAVFYGTVPFFIMEYGQDVIKEYAGKYSDFLTVMDKEDLKQKVETLKNDAPFRKRIIEYMRKHLRFMDSKFFVDDVLKLIKTE